MSMKNIEQYFTNQNWKYETLNENTIKKILKCDNSTFAFFIQNLTTNDGEPNVLGIKTYIAEGMFNNITQDKKIEIFEALNKLGNEYYFGKFHMDEDNDIILSHFLTVNNKFVDEQDFLRVLSALCNVADESFAILMKLRWS